MALGIIIRSPYTPYSIYSRGTIGLWALGLGFGAQALGFRAEGCGSRVKGEASNFSSFLTGSVQIP